MKEVVISSPERDNASMVALLSLLHLRKFQIDIFVSISSSSLPNFYRDQVFYLLKMDSPQAYTLYFNKWSICSQMILLTLAFKGEPKDDSASMTVEQKHIDIMSSEQLEEAFLTKVNPKGQVRSSPS